MVWSRADGVDAADLEPTLLGLCGNPHQEMTRCHRAVFGNGEDSEFRRIAVVMLSQVLEDAGQGWEDEAQMKHERDLVRIVDLVVEDDSIIWQSFSERCCERPDDKNVIRLELSLAKAFNFNST